MLVLYALTGDEWVTEGRSLCPGRLSASAGTGLHLFSVELLRERRHPWEDK